MKLWAKVISQFSWDFPGIHDQQSTSDQSEEKHPYMSWGFEDDVVYGATWLAKAAAEMEPENYQSLLDKALQWEELIDAVFCRRE